MAYEFTNKVAIVTGSSSGIGEAISLMFASSGAKVTLCGRDTERLKYVHDQAVSVSDGHVENFLVVQGDINVHQIRKQIVGKTVEKFGRLDILVANAGISGLNMSIFNATENSFTSVMDTNLKAVFFLIQEAVPHLEKTIGNIVNISSVASDFAIPNMTIYCVSKTALDHLTRCLAAELGAKGIRVNSVNPAYVTTRFLRNFKVTAETGSEFSNCEKNQQALSERDGTLEDIVEAVAFLTSNRAAFITGENMRVDGGRHLNGPSDVTKLTQKS